MEKPQNNRILEMSVMSIKLGAWIPTPKFIVWTILTLALLVFVLKAGAANATVAKARTYLGLSA